MSVAPHARLAIFCRLSAQCRRSLTPFYPATQRRLGARIFTPSIRKDSTARHGMSCCDFVVQTAKAERLRKLAAGKRTEVTPASAALSGPERRVISGHRGVNQEMAFESPVRALSAGVEFCLGYKGSDSPANAEGQDELIERENSHLRIMRTRPVRRGQPESRNGEQRAEGEGELDADKITGGERERQLGRQSGFIDDGVETQSPARQERELPTSMKRVELKPAAPSERAERCSRTCLSSTRSRTTLSREAHPA